MTLETTQNNREALGLTRNVMTATNVEKLVEHSWHHLSVEKVARLLETDLETGLSSHVSAQRREILGPNQLTPQKQQSAWLRFFQQLNQPLIYILLAAGIVTAFLKEWIDSGVILGVALTNATIGFVQESKAENAIAALAKSVATEATVLRNGQKQVVSSSELVPGDLVLLSSGDKVSADLRLIEVRDLQVDESALTGESVPVQKQSQALEADAALADRTNMAYTGSLLTYSPAWRRGDSLRFIDGCYRGSLTLSRRTFRVVPMPQADFFYIYRSVFISVVFCTAI